jgi:glycerol-3-phosphate acyltransferase PlsY
MMNPYVIAVVVGYLLGSIPCGYILVRAFRGEDVRASGSGNIGATNVARTSPVLGVLTLALDALKGIAAVLSVHAFFPGPNTKLLMTLAALAAVVGHMFPLWLNFRGGKGVATSFGAFALIAPKSVLCLVGIFLVIVAALRHVSLGSVAAAAAFPLLAWLLREASGLELALMGVTSLLVIWKHRQNISRLLAGTEPKVGAKRA